MELALAAHLHQIPSDKTQNLDKGAVRKRSGTKSCQASLRHFVPPLLFEMNPSLMGSFGNGLEKG